MASSPQTSNFASGTTSLQSFSRADALSAVHRSSGISAHAACKKLYPEVNISSSKQKSFQQKFVRIEPTGNSQSIRVHENCFRNDCSCKTYHGSVTISSLDNGDLEIILDPTSEAKPVPVSAQARNIRYFYPNEPEFSVNRPEIDCQLAVVASPLLPQIQTMSPTPGAQWVNSTRTISSPSELSEFTTTEDWNSGLTSHGSERRQIPLPMKRRRRNTANQKQNDPWEWNKYGQKPLKDASKYRSYYRCANKTCQAKKVIDFCVNNDEVASIELIGGHSHGYP